MEEGGKHEHAADEAYGVAKEGGRKAGNARGEVEVGLRRLRHIRNVDPCIWILVVHMVLPAGRSTKIA